MRKNIWPSAIITGLAGQLAWTVENMYLNVFLYNTISQDPGYIAAMVALSAITATVTTLLMGTVSDRTGQRKSFIVWGYLLWAVSIAAFGFVDTATMRSVKAAAVTVVVLDCVMTFFGSTANDAVFNAYITENVDTEDRAKVESVIQILPMASMLLIFGLMDAMTQRGEWRKFFLIIALLVQGAAVASFFILDGTARGKKSGGSFLSSLSYGFRPSTIKENWKLYTVLAATCVNAVGMQVFYPYLIIYIQNYLGFDSYAIILAIVLVAASAFCVVAGKKADKRGIERCIVPSVALSAIGMVMMFFARSFLFTCISGITMMAGYLLTSSLFSSLVRENTPEGKEGGIQGVRMIFTVMVPMILGPFIGAAAIRSSGLTYVELGVTKSVPSPSMFLIAALFVALSATPFIKKEKRR